MNRLLAFLLSAALILSCTACVGPVSAVGGGTDTSSSAPSDHDEQLLHGTHPPRDDSPSEKGPEKEPVTSREPETSEPSSGEPAVSDPGQLPAAPESADGASGENAASPESPRTVDPT